MLRISMIDESEQCVRVTLEGWLVGAWVDELRKESEQRLSEAKSLLLDLAKVLFVDARGVDLLRELAGRQVEYVNCSNFLSQQIEQATILGFGAAADVRELNSVGTPPELDAKVARERELIGRVLAGEKELFYELIRPCERGVFLAAASILGNDADAEDAAQEAFLKAYRNLDRFRQESKFSTWLIQIAINDARMKLRKDRRHLYAAIDAGRDASEGDYIPGDITDWREIPSEALEQSELREALNKALNSLPEKYRIVMILRDVQQMSIAETAKALGISEENVKTRTSRARLQMRELLAPGWGAARGKARSE